MEGSFHYYMPGGTWLSERSYVRWVGLFPGDKATTHHFWPANMILNNSSVTGQQERFNFFCASRFSIRKYVRTRRYRKNGKARFDQCTNRLVDKCSGISLRITRKNCLSSKACVCTCPFRPICLIKFIFEYFSFFIFFPAYF